MELWQRIRAAPDAQQHADALLALAHAVGSNIDPRKPRWVCHNRQVSIYTVWSCGHWWFTANHWRRRANSLSAPSENGWRTSLAALEISHLLRESCPEMIDPVIAVPLARAVETQFGEWRLATNTTEQWRRMLVQAIGGDVAFEPILDARGRWDLYEIDELPAFDEQTAR